MTIGGNTDVFLVWEKEKAENTSAWDERNRGSGDSSNWVVTLHK